ncbi:hypothetical protein PV08_02354 [Exophiala spinifera]|uniref:Uncharacterized protein n=1 Tax=Exophiala spinifera TaxID=91928 RepID=A0A0D1ZZF7_9EURO|nr:uncharacterized protein PV08_02354 [Exophiala spinifera]KIW18067.1 hypothetical protein PV08_02354 [Exophiala spinifera]
MADTPEGLTFIPPDTPLKKPELDTIGEVTAGRHNVDLGQARTADLDSDSDSDSDSDLESNDELTDDDDDAVLGKRNTGYGNKTFKDDEGSEIALQAITVTLSPDLSFAKMRDLRDRFVQKLQAVNISKASRLVNSKGDIIGRKGSVALKMAGIHLKPEISRYHP